MQLKQPLTLGRGNPFVRFPKGYYLMSGPKGGSTSPSGRGDVAQFTLRRLMKSRIIGKAVSVLALSMLLSLAMHHYQASRGQMGREEYLAKQAKRFDKHYAKPDPFIFDMIGCMFLAVPLLGVYEGIAWAVSKTLKGIDGQSSS